MIQLFVVITIACTMIGTPTRCYSSREPRFHASSTQTPTTSQPTTAARPDDGVSREEDAHSLPGPPGTVHLTHRDGRHIAEWSGTRDDTIVAYVVYRRCPGGTWEEVARVKVHKDDKRNRGAYRFEENFDAVCEYTVSAARLDGRPGPKTVEIQ